MALDPTLPPRNRLAAVAYATVQTFRLAVLPLLARQSKHSDTATLLSDTETAVWLRNLTWSLEYPTPTAWVNLAGLLANRLPSNGPWATAANPLRNAIAQLEHELPGGLAAARRWLASMIMGQPGYNDPESPRHITRQLTTLSALLRAFSNVSTGVLALEVNKPNSKSQQQIDLRGPRPVIRSSSARLARAALYWLAPENDAVALTPFAKVMPDGQAALFAGFYCGGRSDVGQENESTGHPAVFFQDHSGKLIRQPDSFDELTTSLPSWTTFQRTLTELRTADPQPLVRAMTRLQLDQLSNPADAPSPFIERSWLSELWSAFLRAGAADQDAAASHQANRRAGFVLTGGTGTGKTEWAARTALTLLEHSEHLVVFISGRTIAGHDTPLLHKLSHHFGLSADDGEVLTFRLLLNALDEQLRTGADGRRMAVIIDAVNEAPHAEDVLQECLELIQTAADFPWCKVLLTLRCEFLSAVRAHKSDNGCDVFSNHDAVLFASELSACGPSQFREPVIELPPFECESLGSAPSPAELAYTAYQQMVVDGATGCRTPWPALSAETQSLLANPLLARLFHTAYAGEEAPDVITRNSVLAGAVRALSARFPEFADHCAAVLGLLLRVERQSIPARFILPHRQKHFDKCGDMWAGALGSPVDTLAATELLVAFDGANGARFMFQPELLLEYLLADHWLRGHPDLSVGQLHQWIAEGLRHPQFANYWNAFQIVLDELQTRGRTQDWFELINESSPRGLNAAAARIWALWAQAHAASGAAGAENGIGARADEVLTGYATQLHRPVRERLWDLYSETAASGSPHWRAEARASISRAMGQAAEQSLLHAGTWPRRPGKSKPRRLLSQNVQRQIGAIYRSATRHCRKLAENISNQFSLSCHPPDSSPASRPTIADERRHYEGMVQEFDLLARRLPRLARLGLHLRMFRLEQRLAVKFLGKGAIAEGIIVQRQARQRVAALIEERQFWHLAPELADADLRIGRMLALVGDLPAALTAWRRARALFHTINQMSSSAEWSNDEAIAELHLGQGHEELGNDLPALDHLRAAKRLLAANEVDEHDTIWRMRLADVEVAIADILLRHDPDQASNHYAHACHLIRQVVAVEGEDDAGSDLADALSGLAISLAKQQKSGAIPAFQESADLLARAFNRNKSRILLEELAVACSNLGHALADAGQYDRALTQIRKSRKIRRRIAENSTRPTALRALALAEKTLGELYFELEKYDAAAAAFRRSRDALRAFPHGPGHPGITIMLARVERSLGEAEYLRQRTHAALSSFIRARVLLAPFVRESSDVARMYADVATQIGGVYFVLRKSRLAELSFKRARRLLLELISRDGFSDLRGELARVENKLGEICQLQGQPDKALAHHRTARTMYQQMVHKEARQEFARFLGYSEHRIGVILIARGSYRSAMANLNRAVGIYGGLARGEDGNEFHWPLAMVQLAIAHIHSVQQRFHRAQTALNAAQNAFTKLVNFQDNPLLLLDMANTDALDADVRAQLSKPLQAAALYRRACNRYTQLIDQYSMDEHRLPLALTEIRYADVMIFLRRFAEAEDSLNQAKHVLEQLAEEAPSTEITFHLARVIWHSGNSAAFSGQLDRARDQYADALKQLEQLNASCPDDEFLYELGHLLCTYGAVLADLNEMDAAILALERAREIMLGCLPQRGTRSVLTMLCQSLALLIEILIEAGQAPHIARARAMIDDVLLVSQICREPDGFERLPDDLRKKLLTVISAAVDIPDCPDAANLQLRRYLAELT